MNFNKTPTSGSQIHHDHFLSLGSRRDAWKYEIEYKEYGGCDESHHSNGHRVIACARFLFENFI